MALSPDAIAAKLAALKKAKAEAAAKAASADQPQPSVGAPPPPPPPPAPEVRLPPTSLAAVAPAPPPPPPPAPAQAQAEAAPPAPAFGLLAPAAAEGAPAPAPAPAFSPFGAFTTKTQGGKTEGKKAGAKKTPAVNPKTVRVGMDGKVWQDSTLAEWPENDFRLFVGNLSDDVSSEGLKRAFSEYKSMQKAKVVRNSKTQITKGYGFVSFSDPTEALKALREKNGKYIGLKPVEVKKSKWADAQALNTNAALNVLQQQQRLAKGKAHTVAPGRFSPY